MAYRVSWRSYDFQVFEHEHRWEIENKGGIYIFAGMNDQAGLWQAYYVGETGDLAHRIPRHEQWEEAKKLGATHVHVFFEEHGTSRLIIRNELVRSLRPTVNQYTYT